MDAAAAAGVDIEQALARLGGKLKVYSRTLQRFTADLRGMPEQLTSLLQSGERDAVRRDLHTLKGVAATVGVTPLSKLAGEAEAQLAGLSPTSDEAGSVARVAAAIDLAARSLAALCAALTGVQPVDAANSLVPASALAPDDTALLASMLRNVQDLLNASDLDAVAALRALRSRVPAAASPRLDVLETEVESLEFESALLHCNEWLTECET
jgi:two-component system sensor histidine kinase/response regulator